MSCFRGWGENTRIVLPSDTCYVGTLIGLGTRRQFRFSFRGFFRHSVCIFCSRLNSSHQFLTHVMHTSLEFGVLSSSLRPTAACFIEEKFSISHVEIVQARRPAAWSVYTFGLASPIMHHQLVVESGENGDFFGFRRCRLYNRLYFESREVGRDASGWLARCVDSCSLRWFTDGVAFLLFLQISHCDHVDDILDEWQLGVVWEGSGDGLAVAGSPVVHSVRIFVAKAL